MHEIAKQDGVDLYTSNLFIGGCSLEIHYNNIINDNARYSLEINGKSTGEHTSIKNALSMEKWDYITLQQVSTKSGNYSSYNPYAKEIYNYVKSCCPDAKILIHQTWAYEDNSEKLSKTPYKSAEEMYGEIVNAYNECFNDLGADGIIPSGRAMMNAIKLGMEKVHRDTVHASRGVGRYLLALTWYKYLTGKDISNNKFDSFEEPVTEWEREIAIKAAICACN